MKQYTTEKERKQFYQLHQNGETYREIAEHFGVSVECVRMWCRRQRDGGGVEDRYYNPRSGILSQSTQQVRERILEMRRSHPHWGAASIELNLHKEEDLRGSPIPSRASIGRYLYQFPEFRQTPKKSICNPASSS
jgi:transposase